MERILYFDCFSGISGDMTLGALLDLGIDPSFFKSELEKLCISGYHIEIKPTQQNAIKGTDVTVHLTQETKETHCHHHEHGDARNLYDITHLIYQSSIKPRAKELAVSIFTEIAKAEAKVHGNSIEEVHFHEVGAVDSIIDIVGTAICLEYLKIDRISCSIIQDGHGFIECQHGRLPVPVPAVSEMLAESNLTLVSGDIQGELVTPTGFGILKATASDCGSIPKMNVEKVGYGFGKKKTSEFNALRVFLGSTADTSTEPIDLNTLDSTITIIETSLDDETGEILAYTMDCLFDAGALDVYYTPIYMKKNRPAFLLTVLCNNEDLQTMSDILFQETSTIGLRYRKTKRLILSRETAIVETPLGTVRVKQAQENQFVKCKPEFEDCIKLAKKHNLPLREVYNQLKPFFQNHE